jgi:peptidoglycan/xylan/chitin deacetylase (PgdA/CDA1 family)
MRRLGTRLIAAIVAVVLAVAIGASVATLPAHADDCPGNPDALGTSRVLAIDPGQYARLGRMQYPESLPLADKEVVLTFDDGPLPPYSNQILDILASQCVKATYFLVGTMARAYPATVRRIYEEGHTIGTHSDTHPLRFGKLPIDKMRHEIDGGIADVSAALSDSKYLAPFFRIPGLERSDTVESELAARSLIVFSSDTVADDWHHHIKPDQIIALALKRLEARGKGILLLHDIHPTTVAALPGLLKQLKDNGFRIVQVVPSASYMIAMAAKPKTQTLASAMPGELAIDGGGYSAAPTWPKSSDNLTPDDIALPAPDASSFEPDAGLGVDGSDAKWPDRPNAAEASAEVDQTAAKPAERRHHDASDSNDHDRRRAERNHAERSHADRSHTDRSHAERSHGHRHERARAGDDNHRSDVSFGIKSFAATVSPASTAH